MFYKQPLLYKHLHIYTKWAMNIFIKHRFSPAYFLSFSVVRQRWGGADLPFDLTGTGETVEEENAEAQSEMCP